MTAQQDHALVHVLDPLERSAAAESVRVDQVVEGLGQRSFASVMLVFSLIAVSPASAVPGLTATVAVIVFIVVVQMILGRTCLWLPGFIGRRQISGALLRRAVAWLRKPVAWVERHMQARLTVLVRRPWVDLPLGLILVLTLFMPFMELIPTSGSIASSVIALFAAGMLTRDGRVVLLALLGMLALAVAAWQAAYGA